MPPRGGAAKKRKASPSKESNKKNDAVETDKVVDVFDFTLDNVDNDVDQSNHDKNNNTPKSPSFVVRQVKLGEMTSPKGTPNSSRRRRSSPAVVTTNGKNKATAVSSPIAERFRSLSPRKRRRRKKVKLEEDAAVQEEEKEEENAGEEKEEEKDESAVEKNEDGEEEELDANDNDNNHATPKRPRPLSGFMLFAKENRAKIVQENPEFTPAQVGKALGELWRALSQDEQQKYKKGQPKNDDECVDDENESGKENDKSRSLPNDNTKEEDDDEESSSSDSDDGGGKMGAVPSWQRAPSNKPKAWIQRATQSRKKPTSLMNSADDTNKEVTTTRTASNEPSVKAEEENVEEDTEPTVKAEEKDEDGAPKAAPSIVTNSDGVTDLTMLSDGDDDDDDSSRARVSTGGGGAQDITDLTMDDDDDDVAMDEDEDAVIVKSERMAANSRRNRRRSGKSTSASLPETNNGATATTASEQNTEANAKEDDEVVEWVATANEVRLPHMRQHCTDCPFDFVTSDVAVNQKYCPLCYCYVCDVPAKDCTSWASSSTSANKLQNHCHAHDNKHQGNLWQYWKDQREAKSKATMNSNTANGGAQQGAAAAVAALQQHAAGAMMHQGALKSGTGPFHPQDAVAQSDPNLTKCRCCGWFNRFFHCNFHFYNKLHPVGFLDWCHKCGRVASEKDFGKVQADAAQKLQVGDIDMGTKEIQFTIHPRDPREMERYEDAWFEADENASEWQYDEDAMREDVFRHRLGERPTLNMILASVAIVKESDMPTSGTFQSNVGRQHCAYQTGVDFLYRDKCGPTRDKYFYFGNAQRSPWEEKKEATVDETEGIHLKNEMDLVVLQQIQYFQAEGFCDRRAPTPSTPEGKKSTLTYDITAKWDKASNTGTLSVQLFVQPPKGRFKTSGTASFNKLLGAWFGVFPFTLSNLKGSLLAEEEKDDSFCRGSINVPPFQIAVSDWNQALAGIREEMQASVDILNDEAETFRNELCLESTHESKGLGGQSGGTSQTFSQTLERYFKEVFVEDVAKGGHYGGNWVHKGLGVIATHRRMRQAGEGLPLQKKDEYPEPRNQSKINDLCYLRVDERPLAFSLRRACNSIYHGTTSMSSIIAHCENLGHEEVAIVEGLNVELLPFQKQSVQWALERETVEGGIQSLLWPKLPNSSSLPHDRDIFYNPIIQTFKTAKPHVVRGGIIAEEMGLGKTIICLAVILKNPAPEAPASGSPITTLNALNAGSCQWDKTLYARTSAGKPKRGSIISRGTLVICPVSLVGQWIGEAKNRLADPGLVYAYHGGNRKRIAEVLAANAIVVTTYETLKSDNVYWREKWEKKKNTQAQVYVPPLGQIRWWRIICDESHCLSDASTLKSKACMDLVADHKWLVTGTPVQTSLGDFKNQLNFLGLENVNEMFQVFRNTLEHISDRASKQGLGRKRRRFGYGGYQDYLENSKNGKVELGHFMFFLRTLMIRHSQNQTYRGTTPKLTLMSLPTKSERTIEVTFTSEEQKEYKRLEESALSWYENFLKTRKKALSKYVIKLTAKLVQTRSACAGGKYPLDDVEKSEDDDENGDENDSEEEGKKKPRKVQYSDFVFKSKFNKLIELLKEARDNDPSSKSLVFSQFTSSLEFLKDELPRHGFSYRTITGSMSMKNRAKALDDFQNDPPTTIFLLSLRSGSVGLNLTQANRVFLLEPCFNPAIELQSIGRVHRLGQKRNVEVVRLIMADSVETRMRQLMIQKYGSSSSPANDEEERDESDSDEDEDEKKPAAVPVGKDAALCGSLATDKATIVAEEFGLLFGSKESLPGEASAAVIPEPESDEDDDMVPDAVLSGNQSSTTGKL